MSEIRVHCVKCGETFSGSFSTIEKWSYHCPRCRVEVKPVVTVDDTEGDEEDEEKYEN